MSSSQFMDIRYVTTQQPSSVISPDQVIPEALKARNVLDAPSTPFQRMLERMMFEQLQESRDRHDVNTDPTLLSVNPHMNIKAVMAAHPEQEVFYADGAIRIQQAAATTAVPPVAAIPRQAVAPPQLIPPVQTDNRPFRQVMAPTAVSALAMGNGLRTPAEVTHPDHLSTLFKRAASTPVSRVNPAYIVRNDYTFWDK